MARGLGLLLLLAAAPVAGESPDVLSGIANLETEDWNWSRKATSDERLRGNGIDPSRWIWLNKPAEPVKAKKDPRKGPRLEIVRIPRPGARSTDPTDRYAGFDFDEYYKDCRWHFGKAIRDGRLKSVVASIPGVFKRADADDERITEKLVRPAAYGRLFDHFSKSQQWQLARAHAKRTFRAWAAGALTRAIDDESDALQATYVRRLGARARSRSARERLFVYSVLARLKHPRAAEVLEDALAKERDAHVYARMLARRDRATLLAHLDDPRWPVRAAAIRALRNYGDRDVIDALVARLGVEPGRLRDDLALSLNSMTGEHLPADELFWKSWWAPKRESWKPRPPAPVRSLPKVAGATGFYGLWTCSRGIVFCLDASATMARSPPEIEESRYELVCRELERALATLPVDTVINVVVYRGRAVAWAKEPKPLTKRGLRSLRSFLAENAPVETEGSATCQGLMCAFEAAGDTADTIVLLAVAPPHGAVVVPYQLVTEITYRNELRGFAIHTVGETEGFKEALVNLSARNHGAHAGR